MWNNEVARLVEPSMKFDVSFDVSSSDTKSLHDHFYWKFWISDMILTFHNTIITKIVSHKCIFEATLQFFV